MSDLNYSPTNTTNFAQTTLASGITSGATSLTVTSGASFPASNFLATIWCSSDYPNGPQFDPNAEIVLVATRTTNSFTSITRGVESTNAVAHNTTGKVYSIINAVTAGQINAIGSFLSTFFFPVSTYSSLPTPSGFAFGVALDTGVLYYYSTVNGWLKVTGTVQ